MMKIIEGYFATHSKKPFLGNVIIKNGLIKKIGRGKYNGKNKVDFSYNKNHIIFAGMGDVHIHAREDETQKQNYKEDYSTASAAAANGGVVHVSAMPNTPNPVTNKKIFDWHRKRVADLKLPTTVFNYLGIDKNTRPVGKPGEYFYKLYFGKSVGGLTVKYASDLDVILSRYENHFVSFHVEYEPIVEASVGGKTHTDRRPRETINEGLRLLLPLIKKYNIQTKLCHWSTGGESFKLIEEYRKSGCNITLEVSPLHLFFDSSMTEKDPSLWLKIQMNPAIQSANDRKELVQGLKNNFIQYLATDHAPHTLEEKHSAFAKYKTQKEYSNLTNVEIAEKILQKNKVEYLNTCCENNHSGAPWLDTYAYVAMYLMKEHKFSTQDIARVTSYNPGKFINQFIKNQDPKNIKKYGKGFGELKPGYVGSFTVINTKNKTKIKKENLKTKVGWSALVDYEFTGSITDVIHFGEKIG